MLGSAAPPAAARSAVSGGTVEAALRPAGAAENSAVRTGVRFVTPDHPFCSALYAWLLWASSAASVKRMPSLAGPLGALVALAALVGLLAMLIHWDIFDRIDDWVGTQIDKRLPPSWPRTSPSATPKGDAPPSGGDDPPPKGGGSKDTCPDGSGRCKSDDQPVVPPTAFPPECVPWPSAREMAKAQVWDKVTTSIPVLGPLVNGFSLCFHTGPGSPAQSQQRVMDAFDDAARELQEANSIWENSYASLIDTLSPEVQKIARDVLGPDGYVQTVSTAAALPLVHAAYLCVAPVVALLACSAILVWAV